MKLYVKFTDLFDNIYSSWEVCMATFNHYDLRLLNPKYDSDLVDALDQLGHLRELKLRGDVPSRWFFQLKNIFHWAESLGSAHIEGNHTTLADYIEHKLDNSPPQEDDEIQEIVNIELAMQYAEQYFNEGKSISNFFIRELHAITVKGLTREGDETPGAYRKKSVAISQSKHLPPDPLQVQFYMEELMDFLNHSDPRKYDLMKIALAHHRFAWIHPFNNGNGRVVRLLTYALLLQYHFNVNHENNRILNPTAVFCSDRDIYYTMLGKGDLGTEEGLETWCTYVLKGFNRELSKINKLTHYEYVAKKILIPAVAYAKTKGLINASENIMLNFAIEQKKFKSGDLQRIFPELKPYQITYSVKKLLDQKMLQPINENARTYTINFTTSYLLRGVIKMLTEQDFIFEKN